jgi:hypothetical protein
MVFPSSQTAHRPESVEKMNASADKAQTALAIRQKALGSISEFDKGVVDQAGDASWGALRTHLQGYATLPVAEYPDAPRACIITDPARSNDVRRYGVVKNKARLDGFWIHFPPDLTQPHFSLGDDGTSAKLKKTRQEQQSMHWILLEAPNEASEWQP